MFPALTVCRSLQILMMVVLVLYSFASIVLLDVLGEYFTHSLIKSAVTIEWDRHYVDIQPLDAMYHWLKFPYDKHHEEDTICRGE